MMNTGMTYYLATPSIPSSDITFTDNWWACS